MTFSFSQTSKAALTVLALSAVLVSCKKDDNTPVTPVVDNPGTPIVDSPVTPAPAVDKPYIVTMAYAPASGYDYSYFTVPFKDLMTGAIGARGQGTEQVGYFDYKKIGTTIYAIGGLNDVKVTAMQQTQNSELVERGSNVFPAAIADIVEADGSNLLAVSMNNTTNMISFYQLAKNTVTVAKKVDVPTADLYATDPTLGVNYSGMAVVGNKVFLSYYISNKTTFETPNTAQAEVAVYSYPELQFQEVIRDSRVGPIGGFNVKNGLIEDESGNVYAISNSNPANGFSQSTRPSGILKIANGASSFDAGYFFDINSKAGGNAVHVLYLGNGKAFAKLNVTDRAAQTRWSDGMLKAAVIDFNSQTVNMVSGLPEASGDGRRMPAFAEGDNVYTVVKETVNGVSENYIYKVNTTTFTATKGAKTEASFVAGVFKF